MNPLSLFSLLPLLALLGTALGAPKPPTVKRPGLIHRRDRLAKRYTNQVDTSAHAPTTTASKKNIWASLSFDEAASIKQFLHDQASLNLTAVEDAGEWDNTILTVDFIAPNKTDALSYLDGDGELPPRMALASILFGATEEPYVQTFAVGPLPISDETTVLPNTFGSTAPDAKIRVYDQTYSGPYITGIALEIKDIINDLLDREYGPGACDRMARGAALTSVDLQVEEDFSTQVYMWGIDPLWHETDADGNKHVINWVQIWRNSDMITLLSGEEFMFDEGTLLPQGFYIGVDITGRDESNWSLIGFYYGGIFYSSIDEFRTAYESPDFIKLPVNYPSPKYDTDKKGDGLPYDTLPPPRQVQPGGQRFEVDDEQKYVKWMDFEFYIT
jgi:primary-amine oxidase